MTNIVLLRCGKNDTVELCVDVYLHAKQITTLDGKAAHRRWKLMERKYEIEAFPPLERVISASAKKIFS